MQPQVRLWSSLEDNHPLNRWPQLQRCAAGQRWTWDGVQFEVLHPLAGATGPKSNALSCVLRMEGKSGSALLVGDIETPQEQELLARGMAPVDVLLVPHHGSKTSSSGPFLDALKPRLALVQAGYRNRFGHPAPEVLQRYRDRGIAVLGSVQCGAASWQSAQPEQLRCERQAMQRYWHHLTAP